MLAPLRGREASGQLHLLPEAASGAIETKTAIRLLPVIHSRKDGARSDSCVRQSGELGSSMTRGNFLIDPARVKGGKPLNQPAAILTNLLDNGQQFFTRPLTY